MFQADNFLASANPIVNWLRMSLHATQVNNRGPPVTAISLVSPFMDQDLAAHRQLHLHNALPHLRNTQDPGINSAIIQMAKAVSDQAAEAHTARLAKEIAKDQPMLPSTKFGVLFPIL
jgi:hypothetical protein